MGLTDWIAGYAAVLSTVVLIRDVARSKPRMKVRVVHGCGEHGNGIFVAVQNVSQHTIHLAHVSLLYDRKSPTIAEWLTHAWRFRQIPRRLGWVHFPLEMHGIRDGCPVDVASHTSHQIFISDQELEQILQRSTSRKLIAYAQDQLWRSAHSKVFTFLGFSNNRQGIA